MESGRLELIQCECNHTLRDLVVVQAKDAHSQQDMTHRQHTYSPISHSVYYYYVLLCVTPLYRLKTASHPRKLSLHSVAATRSSFVRTVLLRDELRHRRAR